MHGRPNIHEKRITIVGHYCQAFKNYFEKTGNLYGSGYCIFAWKHLIVFPVICNRQ